MGKFLISRGDNITIIHKNGCHPLFIPRQRSLVDAHSSGMFSIKDNKKF
jgi:hypothetical protein